MSNIDLDVNEGDLSFSNAKNKNGHKLSMNCDDDLIMDNSFSSQTKNDLSFIENLYHSKKKSISFVKNFKENKEKQAQPFQTKPKFKFKLDLTGLKK